MSRVLVLCLLALSLPVHAQAYRWVDPATGRTVISDSPPPGNVRSVSQAKDVSKNPDGRSFAALKAAENFPVTLYTSPECVDECQQARQLLNGRGVSFAEKMLQKQEDFDELTRLVGDAFIPSLKVGRQSARGFTATGYNNLLDLAGYPASAPPGSQPSDGLVK